MDFHYQILSMFPAYLHIYLQDDSEYERIFPFARLPDRCFNKLFMYSTFVQNFLADGDWANLFFGDFAVAHSTSDRGYIHDIDKYVHFSYDNDRFANTFPLFQRTDYLDYLFHEPVPYNVRKLRGWYCSVRNLSHHFQEHVARHLSLEWLAIIKLLNSPLPVSLPPLLALQMNKFIVYLEQRQIKEIWALLGIPRFECVYFGPGF